MAGKLDKQQIFDSIPDEHKNGDCFKVAVDTLMKHPKYTLVHAVVTGQGPIAGIEYTHAFCIDEATDMVIDNTQSSKHNKMPVGMYYYYGKISISREYTYREALENLVEYKTYGPWDPVFDNYL